MSGGLDPLLRPRVKPGQNWLYNTSAHAAALFALMKHTGRDLDAVSRQWPTGPIGMVHSSWVRRRPVDGAARPVNPLGFASSARDLGRLGPLVASGGRWKDLQSLPARRLEKLFEPPPKNVASGQLWWLNRPGHWQDWSGEKGRGSFISEAPEDLVAARGAGKRRLYIVPSLGLVVVLRGVVAAGFRPQDARKFDRRLCKLLMAAGAH